MIAVIDLQISNIASVVRALRRMDAPITVTTDPTTVADADAVIIPGVGAFGDGMATLTEAGLISPIRAAAAAGEPVMGICLGMQLLSTVSHEHGIHEGLNLIAGHVPKLVPAGGEFRVPNVGWCDLQLAEGQELLPAEFGGRSVYFTHSYHVVCDNPEDIAATIRFGDHQVAAAIQRGSLMGVQFHPEKSQDVGLDILNHMLCRVTQMVGA